MLAKFVEATGGYTRDSRPDRDDVG